MSETLDVIVIGAGAAGLMCAIEAARRGRRVLVIDHANRAGKKILMSGGGRCNFTNYHIAPDNYLSHNPHFLKSALSRYTQWDFLSLVGQHNIAFHERDNGQLFCDHSSKDIVRLLLDEAAAANVRIQLNCTVNNVARLESSGAMKFSLDTNRGNYRCESLVVASGGLSIPKMGASPFGYRIAEQFGVKLWPTRAGLVPFTLQPEDKQRLATLSGVSIDAMACVENTGFRGNVLFTHRGLSGPAILQISSYWQPGDELMIDFSPQLALTKRLAELRGERPRLQLNNALQLWLPKRSVSELFADLPLNATLHSLTDQQLGAAADRVHNWRLKPNGTEGYRTAEVTLGGVDCDALSPKSMESNDVPGLYFIGEVVDVTGWLGGYNFQWAWSSGWCAGQSA